MSKPIYSIWVIKSRIFNNPKRYYISLILACIPLILFAQIYEVDTIFVTASRVVGQGFSLALKGDANLKVCPTNLKTWGDDSIRVIIDTIFVTA